MNIISLAVGGDQCRAAIDQAKMCMKIADQGSKRAAEISMMMMTSIIMLGGIVKVVELITKRRNKKHARIISGSDDKCRSIITVLLLR